MVYLIFPYGPIKEVGPSAMVCGVWIGRASENVFLKAIGRAPEVEDGDEIISYSQCCFRGCSGMLLWRFGLDNGHPGMGCRRFYRSCDAHLYRCHTIIR